MMRLISLLFAIGFFGIPAAAFASGFHPTHHWHYDHENAPQCDLGCHQHDDDCIPDDPPPPVDVCPNLDDAQASVPEGYELIEGQCVLIPPPPIECEEGTVLQDNECVLIDPVCELPQVLNAEQHVCETPPTDDGGGTGGGGGEPDPTPPPAPPAAPPAPPSGGGGGGGNGPIWGSLPTFTNGSGTSTSTTTPPTPQDFCRTTNATLCINLYRQIIFLLLQMKILLTNTPHISFKG